MPDVPALVSVKGLAVLGHYERAAEVVRRAGVREVLLATSAQKGTLPSSLVDVAVELRNVGVQVHTVRCVQTVSSGWFGSTEPVVLRLQARVQ